jgi:chromosomal replication initiator protein
MNPSKTFDSFTVRFNNQFAQAAALAVAENPAKAYNPLFIYGDAGVGKTHLLHSIGHHVSANNKGAKVIYISCEEFANELTEAIRNGDLVRFRNRYRQADVVLFDDAHLLVASKYIQKEFFHTFNALFDGHKQIVLASRQAETQILSLDEWLDHRFEWALVAEILPPDMEKLSM